MNYKPQKSSTNIDIVLGQQYMPPGYLFIRKIKPYRELSTQLAFKATNLDLGDGIDPKIYSIQLYGAASEQQLQSIYDKVQSYYSPIRQKSKNIDFILNHPSFLRIYDFGITTVENPYTQRKKRYIYIVRQYVEEFKLLADVEVFWDKIEYYMKQVINTLETLNRDGINYGEISPWQIILGNPKLQSSYQPIKLIDTYLFYLLNPPVDAKVFQPYFRYLSADMLSSRYLKNYHPNLKDDRWGCFLLIYRLVTYQNLFERYKTQRDMIEWIQHYMNSDEKTKMQVLSCFKDKERRQNNQKVQKIIQLLGKLPPFNQSLEYKDLKQIINNLKHGKQISKQLIKQIEEKEKQNNEMQTCDRIVVENKDKFFEVAQQYEEQLEQDNTEQVLEYLGRVAFTVYGERIIKLENYQFGVAKGTLQYVKPNQQTQKVIFQEGKDEVVMVDCIYYVKNPITKTKLEVQSEKSNNFQKQFRKAKLFFKYDGSNPLNISDVLDKVKGIVRVNLEFKQTKFYKHDKKSQEDLPAVELHDSDLNWKSYDEQDILQFNETSIMQMAERLNGIELNKDYLDNLKENRKKFQKMFTTPTVELYKSAKVPGVIDDSSKVNFSYESIALFSSGLTIRHISLGNNQLGDWFLDVLKNNNYNIFRQTKVINLSNNHFTDKTLEIIRDVSKKQTGHNFRYLQILNLAYNQITECTAFRGEGNKLMELRSLYLSHNKVKNIDEYTFKKLPKIKLIDLQFNGVKIQSNVSTKQTAKDNVKEQEIVKNTQAGQESKAFVVFKNCFKDKYMVII